MTDGRADILIIGAGAVGLSAAVFLTSRFGFEGRVVVVDRDPQGARSQTVRSAASLRQQFSIAENIRLSREGLALMEDLKARHGAEGDIGFREGRYLVLCDAEDRDALARAVALQRMEGAATLFLDEGGLQDRFGWLRADGLCGSLGQGGEGWFDPWRLLSVLKREAVSAGATILGGAVRQLDIEAGRVTGALFEDGTRIAAGLTILCAGCHTPQLLERAGQRIAVEPVKRSVFSLATPDPVPEMPLVALPSGVWVRPEGAGYIAGWSPPDGDDPASDPDDDAPDTLLFEDRLWPLLAERIPAFERLKMTGAWAGHYDMNRIDQNALLGAVPWREGLLFACGFSGHGVQHALPMGRALAELALYGGFRSLDLSRLSPSRPEALTETGII
ncbi:MAG: FAD-binding oxidoreductase [Hyphomicrobiaceae bacterium]|nr:FAD-binding oxidoreductase [Hyphomicrobiaceae bacterium]